MGVIIQLKRGTAARWKELNLLLERGEPGFEIDTNKLKIGDGSTLWNDLPYITDSVVSLSPDGESLALEKDGVLTIYGYKNAKVGQIPIKTETGLSWIMMSEVAKTGDVKDLTQTQTLEFFGGSATELINQGGAV